MKGFCAAGQFDQVPLERLGEGVEEAPDVARLELFVTGFPPFPQDFRDRAVGYDADIAGPDHKVVRVAVVDVGQLVVGKPGVLVIPAVHQPADGGLDEAGQIPSDETGVFSGQFDLTRKRQIIANHYLSTCDDSCRERLVVGVADPQHPAIISTGCALLDFHQSEVTGAVMAQAVGLIADDEAVGSEGLFDMGHQRDVGDGSPGLGGPRRFDVHDLFAFHRPGSAMQQEVWAATRCLRHLCRIDRIK